MRNQFIIFSVVIYVCTYAQDNFTSLVSLTNGKEFNKVESPDDQKNKSAENSIDVHSKTAPKISITIESDLSSQQNLTTPKLFKNNETNAIKHDDQNITNFVQEQNNLNDSLRENSPNNTTIKTFNQNIWNENEESVDDFHKNGTTSFSTVNVILNTSYTSPNSVNKNINENFTTNESIIEDSPMNNSSRNEIKKTDENPKLENTTINDNLKQNLSYSTIESNTTEINGSTQPSKESNANNDTIRNESVTKDEYINETFFSKDSYNNDDSDESTSEDVTLNLDFGDILDINDISDFVDGDEEEEVDEDEEEGIEEYDDDYNINELDSSDGVVESKKSTTKKNTVKENNNEINQNSKGLGIFPKLAIFTINVGFVFVAFWLTKTFIDKRVFQEVFSPSMPPNGYVVGNSEIFLHKSVQVDILKQPFTEKHKTTEYLGIWFF